MAQILNSSNVPSAISCPLSIIPILLHIFSAISNTWVVKNIVEPSSAYLCNNSFNIRAARASSPTVGSSKTSPLVDALKQILASTFVSYRGNNLLYNRLNNPH